MSREKIDQRAARQLWLAMIAGSEPATSLLEIRSKRPGGGMSQQWIRVRELDRASRAIGNLAESRDVFVGVVPRTRESGKLEALASAYCLWVDCDTLNAVEALRKFSPRPSFVNRSGSGDNLHAFWQTSHPMTPRQVARANRRLVLRIGADRAATDAPRIMRPPGSLNWKHSPPRPVDCVHLDATSYTLAEIVGTLPDDPADAPRPKPAPRSAGSAPKVLEGLVRVVAEATEGERNRRLNWASYRAADHIATGVLDRESVEVELLAAALTAGLGEREALRTIQSGLDAGRVAA